MSKAFGLPSMGFQLFVVFQEFSRFVAHRFVGAWILFSSFGFRGFRCGVIWHNRVFNAPSLGLKCVGLRLVVCPPDRFGDPLACSQLAVTGNEWQSTPLDRFACD